VADAEVEGRWTGRGGAYSGASSCLVSSFLLEPIASRRPSERQTGPARKQGRGGSAFEGVAGLQPDVAGEPEPRARPRSSRRYSGLLRLERTDFGDAEKASSKRCEAPPERIAASAQHVATGGLVAGLNFTRPDGRSELGMNLKLARPPFTRVLRARTERMHE
jgi:hypothetical protein